MNGNGSNKRNSYSFGGKEEIPEWERTELIDERKE